jgi:predicted  nucleic acid-binding Zn-ribbon protein
MADLETDLEKALLDLMSSGSVSAAGANDKVVAALESKIGRLQEKLRANELKIADLQSDVSHVSELKEALRERSINVKELTRSLEEQKEKSRNYSGNGNGSPKHQSEVRETRDLQNKVAELFDENRRLKQALAAATTTAAVTGTSSAVSRGGK